MQLKQLALQVPSELQTGADPGQLAAEVQGARQAPSGLHTWPPQKVAGLSTHERHCHWPELQRGVGDAQSEFPAQHKYP